MKKCLIILPFVEYFDAAQLINLAKKSDLIICADGGQSVARDNKITPDVVIGDFDSTYTDKKFDCEYITYPVEKDLTDGEACLGYALDHKCDEIIFYGGMGGRFDHTLGALALLVQGEGSFARVRLLDAKNIVEVVHNRSVTLHRTDGYNCFGVVPVHDHASGITITGAKYNVKDIDMFKDKTLGIGNEIVDDAATITVKHGWVYVTRSK